MNNSVTLENKDDVIKEIEDAFFDIPFENSQFQTENFVINAALTPQRAYRAIGLRMHNRLRALREAQFSREREDIDIEELREKLNDPELTTYDIRRAAVDINQKLANRGFTDKLINDAIKELNVLYVHFQRLPRYTRDEFEAGEKEYFARSLSNQMNGVVGAAESLQNMSNPNEALTYDKAGSLKGIDDGRT